MVHLFSLSEGDSLRPETIAGASLYQDSVREWLVEAVSQASRLGSEAGLSDFLDHQIEDVPDSALQGLDSTIMGLAHRDFDLLLPNPLPPRVLQALRVFTGPGRSYFQRWLNRQGRYSELIIRRLEERNMPRDLIYLSMIESGFNPKAWSHAGASGIWQFIAPTGRRYGLMDDWWVDPRRDPFSATQAALDYLEDLFAEFSDWHLAMAAYNCGEGRVRRELQANAGGNYWELPLPPETRFYVPKILAAMIIGHNPEAFGFNTLGRESSLSDDTATIRHCLPLSGIAKALAITEDSLQSLNPALRRWCTPPGQKTYLLRLPSGKREQFYANYKTIDTATLVSWRRYIVARGENLSTLSIRFGVTAADIQSANHLAGSRIRQGQSLVIPVPDGQGGEEDAERPKPKPEIRAKYVVQKGETFYDLARRFKVSVHAIREVNNLSPKDVLKAGKVLKIPEEGDLRPRKEPAAAPSAVASREPHKIHLVRKGENLYAIARIYGLREADLRLWNGLKGTGVRIGQKLIYHAVEKLTPKAVSAGEKSGSGPRQFYEIRTGDSLWDVSKRFGCSMDELRKLNPKLTENLRPGQKIRVR